MQSNQPSSFPRKRESSASDGEHKSHETRGRAFWIPAFAGMTNLLLSLIWLYRHTLSYFLGSQCRFTPTCSDYAAEAIRLHGAAKGSALALCRFCKCHPWGGHGFDPVP